MFKLRYRLSAVCVLLSFASSDFGQMKAFDPSWMDTTVNACDNFFRYAVGGWLKGNQIPAAFSSWGVDQIVEKNNFDILKNVLEKAAADRTAAKGSSTQMIGDFYSSCMDETAINAAGTNPIKPYLAEIDNIKTPTDVIKVTADLQKEGFGVMFNFFANADQKKSSINIANIYQGGLSLPNRDYYTNSDDKSKEIRDKFAAHVTRMFVLLGDS